MAKDNNRWISQNFGNLVDLYGGRYVAVANNKVVAVGKRHDLVEKRAKATAGPSAAVVRIPETPVDPLRLFRFS